MEPQKTEGAVDTQNNEGVENNGDESISIPKKDYETLNQTLGSLKREIKDLKKANEPKETPPKKDSADENRLETKLERLALRTAGITHEDDIELARKTAKKWGIDIDEVLNDEDFKAKLERQQSSRTNVEATSNIRSGAGKSQAKNTPEYWVAKGVPPTPADVPDRKTRASIARAMIASTKSGKKFYND